LALGGARGVRFREQICQPRTRGELGDVATGGRNSSRDSGSQADWLGRAHSHRRRPWALPELLGLEPPGDTEELLEGLAERLTQERLALSRLGEELSARRERVAELERRLEAIVHDQDRFEASGREHATSSAPRVVVRANVQASGIDYWLTRCDGFLVEAPAGRHVGVVEGVRFGSRIDRPEQLEVAVGRLRHRRFLVPVDAVEYVSSEQRLVVLDRDAVPRRDLTHALLARARGKPQPPAHQT
jgi:hypothetical protein